MTPYEVQFPSELTQRWPDDLELRIGPCYFCKGDGDRFFRNQTEVYALDQQSALHIALSVCHQAIALLEVCTGELANLFSRDARISQKGIADATGLSFISIRLKVIDEQPLNENQIAWVTSADETLRSAVDVTQRETLLRSILWHARGLRESGNLIDRFLKFWISLEVLVIGEGRDVVRKVRDQLIQLDNSLDQIKVSETVGRIYGVRANIVHHGLTQPHDLEKKTQELKDVLTDLLRQHLNLPNIARSRKHFL